MERLAQSSLNPSIKHPETDQSRPSACTAGGHSTKELSRLLTHLTILIHYMAAPQCMEAHSHTLDGLTH